SVPLRAAQLRVALQATAARQLPPPLYAACVPRCGPSEALQMACAFRLVSCRSPVAGQAPLSRRTAYGRRPGSAEVSAPRGRDPVHPRPFLPLPDRKLFTARWRGRVGGG